MIKPKTNSITMIKNVLLSVATITMLCFLFAGCAGGPDNKAEEDVNEEIKSAEATASSAKEMTEDLYIEIAAQHLYLIDKYSEKMEDVSHETEMKLSMDLNEKMNSLFDEYGVTAEAFEEYSVKQLEDMETFETIMDRIGQRVEELKTGDE